MSDHTITSAKLVNDRPAVASFDPWEAKFNTHYLPPNTAIVKPPRIGLKPKAA